MDTYTIYHREDLFCGSTLPDKVNGEAIGWPYQYKEVARVGAENLAGVFLATQNGDSIWWKNQNVTCLDPEWTRSTSVGDVIRRQSRLWVVDGIGCQPMQLDEDNTSTILIAINVPGVDIQFLREELALIYDDAYLDPNNTRNIKLLVLQGNEGYWYFKTRDAIAAAMTTLDIALAMQEGQR